ncbi:dimethylargininase [Streptacidiphilus carbonis]|uniref:dimethylargininase n=1 Tax=Streptacidiphilus carbonis TaxID=105422 RepID=UPI0034E1A9C5
MRRRRTARPQHYAMCPPEYFAVDYAINPWMDPSRPTDATAALSQWQELCRVLRALGHVVDLVEPVPGLPDMVFAANAATVVEGRVLVAAFRHRQRAPESAVFQAWFDAVGFDQVRRAARINEGEGDHLLVGDIILAGSGFRTETESQPETADYLRRQVVNLTLIDPRFYHLDTALTVLGPDQVMYYPDAFSPRSRATLEHLFPQALLADEQDAVAFGMNAISDGYHVVLPTAAAGLAVRLKERGYEPVSVNVDELMKAGGGPKCCTLNLRRAAGSKTLNPSGGEPTRPGPDSP